MASLSISSSPISLKHQQLSTSTLLSSPNTSTNSSSCSSSTTLSPNNLNLSSTSPSTHYNSLNHQQHLHLSQLHQQQLSQQQNHHLTNSSNNNNNNLNINNNNNNVNTNTTTINIKKEPGLISPSGLIMSSIVKNENNSFVTSTTNLNNNNNCNPNQNINIKNSIANNNNISSPINNLNGNVGTINSNTVTTNNSNNINGGGNSSTNNEMFTTNNNNNNIIIPNSNSKCKRKINFSHLGIPNRGHQPATVARRNARERNRVKQVNNGFAALKQHIPLSHRSKKMSKVETLRCAVDYIKNLKTLLDPNGLLFSSEDGSSSFDQLQFDFGLGSGSGGSTQQLSPTSSEDPSSPSYASEGSYVNSNCPSTNNNNNNSSNNNNNNNGLYDYENYEPVSPEDEELIEAISWWQQS